MKRFEELTETDEQKPHALLAARLTDHIVQNLYPMYESEFRSSPPLDDAEGAKAARGAGNNRPFWEQLGNSVVAALI